MHEIGHLFDDCLWHHIFAHNLSQSMKHGSQKMGQLSDFQVPKLLWSLGMLGASQSTLMKHLCLEATSVVCSGSQADIIA